MPVAVNAIQPLGEIGMFLDRILLIKYNKNGYDFNRCQRKNFDFQSFAAKCTYIMSVI